MPQKLRQINAVALLVIGAGLLFYGLNLHVQPVFSEENDRGLATQETVLVREVSIGGLRRHDDGKLHKTYTGAPPQACPT